MSKLGYFLGGTVVGIIGTALAAYAVDACSSNTDTNAELGEYDADAEVANDGATADATIEESCTA